MEIKEAREILSLPYETLARTSIDKIGEARNVALDVFDKIENGLMVELPCKLGNIICNNGRGYDWVLGNVGVLVQCNEDFEWYTLAELATAINEITTEKAEAALKEQSNG